MGNYLIATGSCCLKRRPLPKSPEVTGIDAEPASVSVLVGESNKIEVTAIYDDSSTENVTSQAAFISDDDAIATVNSTGEITAAAEGITKITVSFESYTDTVDVTVEENTPEV